MGSIFTNSKTYRFLYFVILALGVFNFFGLFGELMEADAALYASISKTIALTNEWSNLYVNSVDWLDKPHLTFWLAAASFKIFGVSAFAYKLPSFLISLVGFWYLFKLARAIYGEKTALIAVVISMSALHQVISNYDVRAEGYLSTFAIAAIYHFYRARNSSFKHIVAGALFSAFAVMVKGIFVLIPIFGGFVVYWIFTRQFGEFLRLKWYAAVGLVLLFIFPELGALYQQFDLHPEKIVFGQQGVSGLKFFFWDSQFGRFFNNGPIKGHGEISFFVHTTLWAFLPWSIAFVAALIQLTKRRFRQLQDATVMIIWGSAALTFLIFSLSQFQLPHYIIIIFPQFAMITANYIVSLTERQQLVHGRVLAVLGFIVLLVLTAIANFLAVENALIFYVAVLLLIIAIAVITYRKENALIKNAIVISVSFFVFLYGFFYPTILRYQAGLQAAKWMNEHLPNVKAASLDDHAFAFDFYHRDIVRHFQVAAVSGMQNRKDYAFFVNDEVMSELKLQFPIEELAKFQYYRITKLKAKFVNAKTRNQVLTHFYLIKIK